MRKFFGILFLGFLLSCKPESDTIEPSPKDPWQENYTEMNYSMGGIPNSGNFNPIKEIGKIESALLTEASGLAPCTYRSDWLYAHNDGGDTNRYFILDTSGKHVKSVFVTGIGNRDMEDMAIDHNPLEGNTYIYLGEIGDNDAVYPQIKIYRFREEIFPNNGRDTTTLKAEIFNFIYPDGPRDAEALLVDPWSHHLYIITKRDSRTRVYKAHFPFNSIGVQTLQLVATLPFSGVVAGDISADGKNIVLKTYLQALVWERNVSETVVSALSRQPKLLPYKFEKQGEAFCWSADAQRYYTVSEGKNEPIYMGSRK